MKNRRTQKESQSKKIDEDDKYKKKNKPSSNLNAAILISMLILGLGLWNFLNLQIDQINVPFPGPKIIDENSYRSSENIDRYWGTYRPQLYFGLKTRSQNPLNVGMIWFNQFSPRPQIRHWCDQGDGLNKYGWIAHDGRNFGIHDIYESDENNFHIRNSWVKRAGGKHGGDWSVRTEITSNDAIPKFVSLIFYFQTNQTGWIKNAKKTSFEGETSELGRFNVKIYTNDFKNIKIDSTNGFSHQVNLRDELVNGHFIRINAKLQNLKEYFGFQGVSHSHLKNSDFIAYQISGFLPFSFEVVYQSESSLNDNPVELKQSEFDSLLSRLNTNFQNKFESVFKLRERKHSDAEIMVAQAALSNMLGGLGFFYGQSIVKSGKSTEVKLYWPGYLYTAVPSRSFFPRGFLWDEGFHNLLIQKWDNEISRDIISHWLDLMNIEGWIPREVIFGDEARAKVPEEFWIQNNEYANPPTLILPLSELLKNVDKKNDIDFLKRIYPRLKTWYNWFNNSQVGDIPSSYRWRGRISDSPRELNPKTLTSGLDDYPRATHPDSKERHLDLRCWMTLASKVMAEIAHIIDQSEDYSNYHAHYLTLTNNRLLDELHWSGTQYADWGLHSEDVKLVKPPPILKPNQPPIQQEMIRQVLKEPEYQFVNTIGYVSLFPLMLEIIEPQSDKLSIVLDQIQDAKLLWTKYGLRSLAKNSLYYEKRNTEHDPPYWRGAIWINLNYLTLKSLKHYSEVDGPYKIKAAQIYKELRESLVSTIVNNYEDTGYIWEQYNDKTGKGQGSHPFTGWSALITLILSEKI